MTGYFNSLLDLIGWEYSQFSHSIYNLYGGFYFNYWVPSIN